MKQSVISNLHFFDKAKNKAREAQIIDWKTEISQCITITMILIAIGGIKLYRLPLYEIHSDIEAVHQRNASKPKQSV